MNYKLILVTFMISATATLGLHACKKGDGSGHIGQPGGILSGTGDGSGAIGTPSDPGFGDPTNPGVDPGVGTPTTPGVDPGTPTNPGVDPGTGTPTDPGTGTPTTGGVECPAMPDATLAGGTPETWQDCDDRGLVWLPVISSDASQATCGPRKVENFNCCASNIGNVYPSLSAERNPTFQGFLQENLANGFQLHHCEDRGNGTVVFHFYHPNFTDTAAGNTQPQRDHRWLCASNVVRNTSATQTQCPALDMSRLTL